MSVAFVVVNFDRVPFQKEYLFYRLLKYWYSGIIKRKLLKRNCVCKPIQKNQELKKFFRHDWRKKGLVVREGK